MDPTTAIAASGMRARMESLEMLANNIANASTSGYKADREFYSLYVAPEASEAAGPSTMPLIDRPWTDLSQGVLQPTGNSLDVAISGRGFLAVDGPSGALYTRNGNLRIAADGTLVTAEGYAVRSAEGGRIQLNASLPVEIARDGSVGQRGELLGRIAVVGIADAGALAKQGASYFRLADGAAAPPPAEGAVLEQGRLEASNTGSAEAAVKLVGVMRQFEMLQRAVGLAGDMNRKAIEQVAKVG